MSSQTMSDASRDYVGSATRGLRPSGLHPHALAAKWRWGLIAVAEPGGADRSGRELKV